MALWGQCAEQQSCFACLHSLHCLPACLQTLGRPIASLSLSCRTWKHPAPSNPPTLRQDYLYKQPLILKVPGTLDMTQQGWGHDWTLSKLPLPDLKAH